MKHLLKRILNRFVLLVIDLQKDGAAKEIFFRGTWKKGTICLEETGGTGPEGCPDEKWKQWPVLVLFTGYGVVSKTYERKTELIVRIIQGEEFLWEKMDTEKDEEQRIVFVRQEVVGPLLKNIEDQGTVVTEVSLSEDAGRDFLERWVVRIYNRWHTREYWGKKERSDQVLAHIVEKRMRLPILVIILILLGINYPLLSDLQERVVRQQSELVVRQQKVAAYRAGSEKTQKMVRAFSARKKLSPFLDRIAALVPAGITLELLSVNPSERRIEPGKPLPLKEDYVMVEGYTRQTAEVAQFTGRLAEEEPLWRVMLIRLDRREETGDFVFQIGIVL